MPVPCGADAVQPHCLRQGQPGAQLDIGEQTKPPVEAGSGTTIHTNLWDLTYDEADGWVYEEDDLHDDETSSKIILTLPKEGEDGSIVDAEIRVSVEDPYTFRDYLTSYGFDEYEYAVDQAYDLTPVGGIDCLKAEGNYWGSPCLRYMNRVEGAGATVFMEIIGEYEDERVDKLLSGLTIHLEDTGNDWRILGMRTAPGTGKESPSPPSPTAPWWVPTRSAASGSPSPTA